VLRSGRVNYWTGEEGRRFEEEFARAVGCHYGVALANGSVALEAALRAVGVGPGDDVVVTCRSFVASASSVVLVGARPIFADVDPESQNITAATVRKVLTPKTRALIAVHLAGWPCDMDPLMELAKEHRLAIIEDCAQAHGATYRGRPVGSLGHVAAWSFCQDKIMTTGGEGGMVTTNDETISKHVWSYKDHGKSYDAVHASSRGTGFRLHESFGTNWRMTEMQAALGRVMLQKLTRWVEARRRNAEILTRGFRELAALRVTEPPSHVAHSYYKYWAFVRPERLRRGWGRDEVVAAVNDAGVPCLAGNSQEIYREHAFVEARLGPRERLPVAARLGETSLMFMVHPTLGHVQMDATVRAVRTALERATA
jgi:hypothetical protein